MLHRLLRTKQNRTSSGRKPRRRLIAALLAVAVIAGGAFALHQAQPSPRAAGVSAVYINNLSISATGGDKGVVLDYTTSPLKRNNGTIATNTQLVMTVTKPDASTFTFRQKTDNDGRVRGQVYGEQLNQNGVYGLEVQVDGTAVSDSANFVIEERAKLAANSQIFTGNNQIFRNNADSATAFAVQDASGTEILGVDTAGGEVRAAALDVAGTVAAGNFTGDGSLLTGLNASSISNGTLNDARLSSNVPLKDTNNVFTDINRFTRTGGGNRAIEVQVAGDTQARFTALADGRLFWSDGSGTLDTGLDRSGPGTLQTSGDFDVVGALTAGTLQGNGSGLTSLNASNISSGTLNDGRLGPNVTLQGNTFNGANQLVKLDGSGALPAVSGANLTGVNAATLNGQAGSFYQNADNINAGTLNDARLSANVALLGGRAGGQTLNGDTAAGGDLTLSSTANGSKGKIHFGTSAYDEVEDWLGIGTDSPNRALEVRRPDNSDVAGFFGGAGGVADEAYAIFNNRAYIGYDGTTQDALLAGASGKGIRLKVDDAVDAVVIDTDGQVSLPVQGSAGGLVIGGDTNLYRDSANNLRTDDTFSASAYKVGNTAGVSASCSAGQVYDAQVIAGGIVTSGTCVASSGLVTLQNAYNNGRIITTGNTTPVVIQNPSGGATGLQINDSSGANNNTPFLSFNNGAEAFGIRSQNSFQIGPWDSASQTTFDETFEISTNGEALFEPVTDSVDAFSVVSDSDDQKVLGVDTTNKMVGINTQTPETQLQIGGPGANDSEGRLSFGDYDEVDWHGVVVGEFGTGDTDQLQLQGASGIEITTGDTGEFTIIDVDSGTGQTELRPITDGASFIVNNAADNQTPFSVDTGNSRLGVNDATPDARLELEREIEASEENGILLSTSNANDWKLYQPTGSSNLHFWNDDINTDAAVFDLDGQFRLPITGSTGGILIGGDTNLYRHSPNVLATDDLFGAAGVVGTGSPLTLGDVDTPFSFRVSGDGSESLLEATSNQLVLGTFRTDASMEDIIFRATNNGGSTELGRFTAPSGQLRVPITGSSAGIQIGGDTQIYRDGSIANQIDLGSNDSLLIPGGSLSVAISSATAATFNRQTNDGTIVSLRQDGTEEGTISVSGTTVSYNAFTGSHYADAEEPIEPGMLVSQTGHNGRLHGRPDSEILYGVKRSSKANDSTVMGAYLSILNPKTTRNQAQPESASNPSLVMAVGNGEVWVTDTGTDLQSGDNLVSSDVAGHAMVDPGTYPVSHVVAKAAEPVDWSKVEETVTRGGTRVKHKKISVFFGAFDKPNLAATDEARDRRDERTNQRIRELEKKLAQLAGPTSPRAATTESPIAEASGQTDVAQQIAELRAEAIAADRERDTATDERFERLRDELRQLAAFVRSREMTGGQEGQGSDGSFLPRLGLYADAAKDVSGTIDAAGAVRHSDGFSTKRTAEGTYRITFAAALAEVPSPVVTPLDPEDIVICSVHDVTAKGFVVKCRGLDRQYVDQDFTFQAAEPKRLSS